MPSYRIYRLDGAGRITGADWIEAGDDPAALAEASRQADGGRYELWDQQRLVHREIPPMDHGRQAD